MSPPPHLHPHSFKILCPIYSSYLHPFSSLIWRKLELELSLILAPLLCVQPNTLYRYEVTWTSYLFFSPFRPGVHWNGHYIFLGLHCLNNAYYWLVPDDPITMEKWLLTWCERALDIREDKHGLKLERGRSKCLFYNKMLIYVHASLIHFSQHNLINFKC